MSEALRAPWNAQAAQQHEEGSARSSGDPLCHLRAGQGPGSPLLPGDRAGAGSLSWHTELRVGTATAWLALPAQPQAGGTRSQQGVLPVPGILTIPAPNSRHPVLFLLLKSEVLQLLLLSDAHQLLSSPCLSNSRH